MKLQKINFKSGVLAFLLLVICVLSITTLCYDLASYQGSYGGLSLSYSWKLVYGEEIAENGFGMLDGNSTLINGSFNANAGVTFSGIAIICQLACILILVAALISFILLALSFFASKANAKKLAKIIIAINVLCALLYLAIGIYFNVSCNDTYVESLSDSYVTDNTFDTYSYIPLILSFVAAVVYFVCAKFIKEDFSLIKVFSNNKATEEVAASEAVHGAEQKSSDGSITDDGIERLRKLKKLCEDGIITEEDFARQKEVILNSYLGGNNK